MLGILIESVTRLISILKYKSPPKITLESELIEEGTALLARN